jgi:opacity protein-like surface antigen
MRDVFCSSYGRQAARRLRAVVVAIAVATLFVPVAARAAGSTLPPEVGYNYGLTESPRIAAMGGALRATSNSSDALYINPANMATTRVYHITALGQIWPEASRQSYGLSIVDSGSATRLAGGLGAAWNRQDPDGVDRTSWDVRFALAYPFSEHFFVGVAARYLSLHQDGFPRGMFDLRPSQAAAGLDGDPIVKNITFDAGVTVKPVNELSLSLVGANLTDTGYSFLPLTFGGGIGYGTRDFTLEADVLGDFTTYSDTKVRAMAGGEYLAGDHVPVRLGYRYDQGQKSHAITGGIGYVDNAYAVEFALQRVVSGDPATAIIIGFQYHVDGAGGGGDAYDAE